MNKQTFLNELQTLISFETLTGNCKENKKALDWVLSKVNKKASIRRIQNKGVETLIVGNTKSLNPDVGFLVHMDVVAAKEKQFQMKKVGDKLVGRGVSDMKFSIVMGIDLLNELIAKRSKLTFSLVVTTDEEVGGFNGASYIAQEIKFRPRILLVPDGGDGLNFVDKAKGVCQIVIESKGVPSHASRPWMGKNALIPLIKLANKLLKIYESNGKKESWKTTMNIGQLAGGASVNQVCPEATLKLDFRFPETDSVERIFSEVKKLAKSVDKRISVNKLSTGLPTFTDKNLPVVKLFIHSMEEKTGKKMPVKCTYGASDARHFALFNIPVLMTKPIGGEIHSDKEWISISSCLKFNEGLRLFLENLESINAQNP